MLKAGKHSQCRDDKIVQNHKFWMLPAHSKSEWGNADGGLCIDLRNSIALGGTAQTARWDVLGNNTNVVTKVVSTHPDRARKEVGIVMMKRLITHTCTGHRPAYCKKGTTVADVHKVGYCIKCQPIEEWYRRGSSQGDYPFKDRRAAMVRPYHRTKFVQECVSNAMDQDGSIKASFKCNAEDAKYAEATISGF